MENPPAEAVARRFGSEAALAPYRTRPPGATAIDLMADLKTDETFLLPAMRLADAVAARGGNAYAYFFDWGPPASRFRSCHTIAPMIAAGTRPRWRTSRPRCAGRGSRSCAMARRATTHYHHGRVTTP